MLNSIDLFASVNASKAKISNQKSDFMSNSADKPNSFRDSLREASGNINRDDSTSVRKELVSRSEAKLKKMNKQKPAVDEISGTEEETKENKAENITDRIEGLLLTLQELAELQQNGEMSQENQAQLLEEIKEAFHQLTSLQSKLAKLTETKLHTGIPEIQQALEKLKAQLEAALEGLNTEAGSEAKVALSNLQQKLESVIEETMPKLEALSKSLNESSKVQTDTVKADSTMEALKSSMNGADKSLETDEQQKLEGHQGLRNEEAQKVDVNVEAKGTENKTIKNAAGIATEASESGITEEEKAALEGKTEKVTAESKGRSNQETDSETAKQAAGKVNIPAASKAGNIENADFTAMNQNQSVAEDNSQIVTNQVETPKAQNVSRAEIINQIVKKAEIILTDAQSEMRMQLEPENLGKLTLRIAVERGLITAKFTAESQEVKQVLESSFNELKDMLQEKGLEVQNISVSVGQENKEYNNDNAFQQWKETVRLNGVSRNKGSYEGYLSTEADTRKAVNPYSIHSGEFDHIA